MSGRLAVVMSGFPRRSETFALNELRALDAAGMLGYLASTKPGDPGPPQPGCDALLDRDRKLDAEALGGRLALGHDRGGQATRRRIAADHVQRGACQGADRVECHIAP